MGEYAGSRDLTKTLKPGDQFVIDDTFGQAVKVGQKWVAKDTIKDVLSKRRMRVRVRSVEPITEAHLKNPEWVENWERQTGIQAASELGQQRLQVGNVHVVFDKVEDTTPYFTGKGQKVPDIQMSYTMPSGSLRPGLASQYPKGTTTLDLIKDGKRTATTRRTTPMNVGQEFTIGGGKDKYRVVRVQTPDLKTAEGRARFEELEGWDLNYLEGDKKLRAQIHDPKAKQTVFEKVVPDTPVRWISGMQDGVDEWALELAAGAGLETGGWAPRGFRQSKGQGKIVNSHDLGRRYKLKEHSSSDWKPRTEENVKEADLTVIFSYAKNSPGSKLTVNLAKKHGKPYLYNPTADEVVSKINELRKKHGRNIVVNGAGNRGWNMSSAQREQVRNVLKEVNSRITGDAASVYRMQYSTPQMTFGVSVGGDGMIQAAAPIARKFVGKHIDELRKWLAKQGDVQQKLLSKSTG